MTAVNLSPPAQIEGHAAQEAAPKAMEIPQAGARRSLAEVKAAMRATAA